MKIITWNCNGAFRKKFEHILGLGADIFVIQECEDPSRTVGDYNNWAQNYIWIGANKHKGLGIFANNNDIMLQKLEFHDDGLQLFLPCRINDAMNLIAVWTKQTKSRDYRYIGQFWRYLQLHKAEIACEPTLICGDFNSNVCWDKYHRGWSHSDVVRELEEIGVVSLYHELSHENQGRETTPTFYLQRNLEKPYHIDYAFVSKHLIGLDASIEIGKQEKWLSHSDHMPLILTL